MSATLKQKRCALHFVDPLPGTICIESLLTSLEADADFINLYGKDVIATEFAVVRSGELAWYAALEAERQQPVGLIAYTRTAYTYASGLTELVWILVHPEYRRAGVGEALLTAWEQYVRASGIHAVLLDVMISNDASKALFSRCSYTVIGRADKMWYGYDYYLMRKQLSAACARNGDRT